MNLEDCTKYYKRDKKGEEFFVSGLLPIVPNEHDDYFVYGNFRSDRTTKLRENMGTYKAKQNICFASPKHPHDAAYQLDSPTIINQLNMFITEDMMQNFFSRLYDDSIEKETYVTVDLNSLDREFILVLAAMFFKANKLVKTRFLYFSSGDYDLDMWMGLKHNKPEILLAYPGVPSFNSSVLIAVAGYEINAIGQLVDRFKPHKLILGYNKEGVNKEAHEKNLKTHKANREKLMSEYGFVKPGDIMKKYKNSPEKNIDDFACDVRNPIKCCKDIYKVLRKHNAHDKHVKLSVTNTRLSLIGAALFAAQNINKHRVQLVYAKPIDFDETKLSSKMTDYYHYIFDSSHLDMSEEELFDETD